MAHWSTVLGNLHRVPEVGRCLMLARRPWPIVAAYLRIRPWRGPHVIELRSGLTIEVETYEDLVTAWLLFFRREYRIPAGAGTILDLGANIGCFTLLAASGHPEARIVCAEPYPSTFDRLTRTIQRNQLGARVQAWPLGVAAGAGPRVMPHGSPSQSLAMLPAGDAGAPGTATTVDCLSLGEMLRRACDALGTPELDFVKMDIEGAEHEVARAVPREGLRLARFLALEYHPMFELDESADRVALFAAITRHGFELVHDRPINKEAGIAHFRRV